MLTDFLFRPYIKNNNNKKHIYLTDYNCYIYEYFKVKHFINHLNILT